MKKIIGILFVVTCLTATVQAQRVQWGAKAGWNLSNPSFSDDDAQAYKTGKKVGYYIGPTVDISLPLGGLGVDASVLFSQRNVRGGEWSTKIKTLKQTGIEIPINLKYNFDVNEYVDIFVFSGPNLYLDFASDNKKKTYMHVFEKKSPQLGLNIGAGVKVIDHVLFSFNSVLPFSKTAEYSNYSYKTRTWQVGLGYLF
ncbi:MAG: porin family protein [Bacteroides sp.]|nr:porin family protein [Bacteroides sp.]